jgi:hypothetical protein
MYKTLTKRGGHIHELQQMAHAKEGEESIPSAHGGIYRDGPFQVELVSISSHGCPRAAATKLPLKPLVVAVPRDAGEYPVVQFHHGFTLQNSFYSQLISHIASHGFIVVAPQVRTSRFPDFQISRFFSDFGMVKLW